MVADNYSPKLDDNGNLRTDVLQPRYVNGEPTGELKNVTGNAVLSHSIFWAIDSYEGSKNSDLRDSQIELGTINKLLKDDNAFKELQKQNPSYSDTEIREELYKLQDLQKQHGSRGTLTYGQFREGYNKEDGSFGKEMKDNPKGNEILNDFVNGNLRTW
ncbi:MAG: hypothetical protein NTW61_01130 [Candidatus Melainabacteria bacterium]|nr:hypothetical protein [Candidatus Melainabacteria bacterium]